MRVVRKAWKSAPPGLKELVRRVKPQLDLVRLEDSLGTQSEGWTIPPRVFQTCPTRLIHRDHGEAIEKFRALNSNLWHTVFDQHDTDNYMKEHWGNHPIFSIYEDALFGQMKADIFRYCVVFDNGGYYLDINKAIMRRLQDLHEVDDHGLLSFEKNSSVVFPDQPASSRLLHPEKLVLQWGFGFSPQHRILELAINRIVETSDYFRSREFNRVLPTVVSFTGPGVLTWAVRRYLAKNQEAGLAQHSPDFGESGITRLPRSDLAFGGTKHYSKFKHHRVLREK